MQDNTSEKQNTGKRNVPNGDTSQTSPIDTDFISIPGSTLFETQTLRILSDGTHESYEMYFSFEQLDQNDLSVSDLKQSPRTVLTDSTISENCISTTEIASTETNQFIKDNSETEFLTPNHKKNENCTDNNSANGNKSQKSAIQNEAIPNIKPGMLIGNRYSIIALAGQGKMGQVWEAFDTTGEHKVALKFVLTRSPEYLTEIERLTTNYKMLHGVTHQNLCPIHVLQKDPVYGYYIVLNWMPVTLADYCKKIHECKQKQIQKDLFFRIFGDIAKGLDYLHEKGIIHRDVKPANIVIISDKNNQFQEAQLIDFGLARQFRFAKELEDIKKTELNTLSENDNTNENGENRLPTDSASFTEKEMSSNSSVELMDDSVNPNKTKFQYNGSKFQTIVYSKAKNKFSQGINGTPSYMSPEQWCDAEQDGRSDQYSLAVIAYLMLSGKVPFSGNSIQEVFRKVQEDPILPINNMPHYVNLALMKALSKQKEDRFETCVQFVNALSNPLWNAGFFRRKWIFILSLILTLFLGIAMFALLTHFFEKEDVLPPPKIFKNTFILGQGENTTYRLLNLQSEESVKKKKSPSVYDTKNGVRINGTLLNANANDQKNNTWRYSLEKNGTLGILKLNGYNGGAITSSGLNLKIILADGSENTILAPENQIGICAQNSDLSIEGESAGTGKLSIVCQGKRGETAGIFLDSPNKNLHIKQTALLSVQVLGGGDGILVPDGNVFLQGIRSLKIRVDSEADSLYAGKNISIFGKSRDIYEFTGGLWHGGKLTLLKIDDATSPSFSSPVNFTLLGKKISGFIQNYKELSSALTPAKETKENTNDQTRMSGKMAPKVFVISNNIEVMPTSEKDDSEQKRIVVEKGAYQLLSSGNWTVKRGTKSDRSESLLFILGQLELGLPGGMGSAQLILDGEAVLQTADQQESDLSFPTRTGKPVKLKKYEITNPSENVLVHVVGGLVMNDGVTIQNNCNTRPNIDNRTFDSKQYNFAGGVYVANTAFFQMTGGTIRACHSAAGAGVNTNGNFKMSGGTICDNTGFNNSGKFITEGAGVRVHFGSMEMSGGVITRNIALSNNTDMIARNTAKGGGIYLGSRATASLAGGKITDNISSWGGGGIYLGSGGESILEIIGPAEIVHNKAVIGGGIFLNSEMLMTDGIIRDNTCLIFESASPPDGEGIYIREFDRNNLSRQVVCQLGKKARIDDLIYILSNRVAANTEGAGYVYIPIRVVDKLTDEKQTFKMSIGTAVPSHNKVIQIVALTYLTTQKNNEKPKLPLDKFIFTQFGTQKDPYEFYGYSVIKEEENEIEYFLALRKKK